jgi:hypothetical protein
MGLVDMMFDSQPEIDNGAAPIEQPVGALDRNGRSVGLQLAL